MKPAFKVRAFVFISLSLLFGIACATACGQTASSKLSSNGIVRPAQFANLAAAVSESVEMIKVKEGDLVKKGQLLAVLDSRIPSANLAAAKIAAESNDEFARSQWRVAQQKLNRHLIRAPFDGEITRVHVRVNNFVEAGTPVIAMMDSTNLQTELNLPLAYWGRLKVGGNYKLNSSKPVSKIIMGEVIHISRVIDAATQTFRVKLEIENFTERLPVGFRVKLKAQPDENVVASK